jgi:hypothetical protein
MEPRTATQAATDTSHEQSEPRRKVRKPAAKPARKTKDEGALLRGGKRVIRAVAEPAAKLWEERLREPLAKGLITTGAVLTATGRLLLEYGREGAGKGRASAPAGRPAADRQSLH